ncbi:DUF306 protein [Piscinibacter sakaiensis]|uniref:DUF306 protein n=1 Tax=Piscinibacter sakaiensis TaxID=1547922 RepID=A0A0K8P4V1_PISS1|nr:DUF306 protein [Piscinibacter sakaiensis]
MPIAALRRAGAAAALGAAALAAPAADEAPLVWPGPEAVRTAWRIVQARSEPLLDRRQARLEFRDDGRLVGHTSCNALSADYRLDGPRLVLGALVTTRRACAPLLMEQEDRVLSALEAVATARVRPDGLLELRDADGRGLLRAVRADLPE